MDLSEELVEKGRSPGPFLYYGIKSCLRQLKESNMDDRERIIRLLYKIVMKSDPTKEYEYVTANNVPLKRTLAYLIFMHGLPSMTGLTDDEKKIPLFDGKGLISLLETVISWIDSGESYVSILDKLSSALPFALKFYPMDDRRIQTILNLEGIKALRTLALDTTSPWDFRLRTARILSHIFSSMKFNFPPVDIEQLPRVIPRIKWEELLDELGLDKDIKPRLLDRTLVIDISDNERIKIKLTEVGNESIDMLHLEPQWLERLTANNEGFGLKSRFPKPLKIKGSYVLRISDIPVKLPHNVYPVLGYAICIKETKKEFYANDPENVSPDKFIEVIRESSFDLGRLASSAIFHTSVIPLFHNREQDRRYEWWQTGRLDRWLYSCDFPNIGTEGIRDLEHLRQFVNITFLEFMRHVVTEHLGLSLIEGSYFRNKDRTRVGYRLSGEPHDTRDLFDKALLKKAITVVLSSYYEGLNGKKLDYMPIDLDKLCDRMIDELGVDRYMRGREGPDLGEFNNVFSLPELLDVLEYMGILFTVDFYNKLVEEGKVSLRGEEVSVVGSGTLSVNPKMQNNIDILINAAA